MDSGRYSSKTPDGIIASPLLAGMEGGSTIKNNVIPVKGKEEGLLRNTWKHRSLLMLCLPGIIFFFVFCYLPMFGIVVAFQDFNVVEGITGSAFVGLRNFKFFFQSPDALKVILNTLFLNTLFIATSLVMSLAIAIMLSEVKGRIFKKNKSVHYYTAALYIMDGGCNDAFYFFVKFKWDSQPYCGSLGR